MPLIFSTHPLHPSVTARLQAAGEFRIATAPTGAAMLAEGLDADILIVRAPIPAEYILRAKRLRAAIRHGAGLDMIPVDDCTRAGVLVANVPGVNAATVAEHVIWSALALLRRYPAVHADLRQIGWDAARAHADHGRDMTGRRIGIVGMGNVGRALARIARRGFGMEVLALKRRRNRLPSGVAAVSMFELLTRAEIVALCCPLTSETRGMIGADEMALMRPGAVLINVARGPVVAEAALVAALVSGRLGGAALDVFDTQPLPADHPFLAMKNVILTPHMAGITADSMARMGNGAADETLRILAGEMPLHFCNPDAEAAYRKRFAP
jgi:D-3-phosphoglycerate dehydrogenase